MIHIVHPVFSELCIEVVFVLSLEHVMCRELTLVYVKEGDCSGTVVKVLYYKLEGRWFDPNWCHFSLT